MACDGKLEKLRVASRCHRKMASAAAPGENTNAKRCSQSVPLVSLLGKAAPIRASERAATLSGILAAFPANKNQTFCLMQRSSFFSQKESIKERLKEVEFFLATKSSIFIA